MRFTFPSIDLGIPDTGFSVTFVESKEEGRVVSKRQVSAVSKADMVNVLRAEIKRLEAEINRNE